jgi:3-phenylpropionate/cinnamic acid dioxygenase small subunit
VLYFMPRRKNVLRRESHREVTPLGDLALIEDDRRYLEMRVARLDTGMAWGEDPPVTHAPSDRKPGGGAAGQR